MYIRKFLIDKNDVILKNTYMISNFDFFFFFITCFIFPFSVIKKTLYSLIYFSIFSHSVYIWRFFSASYYNIFFFYILKINYQETLFRIKMKSLCKLRHCLKNCKNNLKFLSFCKNWHCRNIFYAHSNSYINTTLQQKELHFEEYINKNIFLFRIPSVK